MFSRTLIIIRVVKNYYQDAHCIFAFSFRSRLFRIHFGTIAISIRSFHSLDLLQTHLKTYLFQFDSSNLKLTHNG